MSYDYTTSFGNGVILAPCLQVLCEEIKQSPVYSKLTNLGEIGDQRHQGQGTDSDHNPFVVHDGKGYIRAIDLGGDRGLLLQLRARLFKLYRAHDPRVYPYGYFKGPDSLINDWPPGTGWHVNTGDEGHLHISVGIKTPNSTRGWISALDSRKPWGIDGPVGKDPLMGDKLSKDVHDEISGIVDRRNDQQTRDITKAIEKQTKAIVAAINKAGAK